jgi:hypothetical protein
MGQTHQSEAMPTSTITSNDRIDALLDRVISDLHAVNPQAAADLEYDLAQTDDETNVQTFTVTAKGEVITFTSTLSDSQVLQTLRGMRSSFAQDLAAKFNRLSEKQYAWAHKLAVDNTVSKKVDDTQPSQFEALFNAFEAAKAKGAKRLTLRFEGINVKPNRDLSALWVTSQTEKEEGNYGLQPKYLGKVTRQQIDSRLSDDVKEVILSASKDPLTAAIRYGKVSGECSCCGRELTDSQSIERGIGPICATKFGW